MADAILQFITTHGYLGVFLLMVAENLFPPIPSEVILPFIGHLTATGELAFVPAVVVATVGAVVGTSVWFVLGWLVSVPVLERFFTRFGGYVAIHVKDFRLASAFFTKHERAAVFFGRMIPTVRSVISIPAGCVRMPLLTFLLYSTIGTLIWNLLLMSAGYWLLQDYTQASRYMGPIADVIITGFIVAYLVQVSRFVWRKYASRTGEYDSAA